MLYIGDKPTGHTLNIFGLVYLIFLRRCRFSRAYLYHYHLLFLWRLRRTFFPSGWCFSTLFVTMKILESFENFPNFPNFPRFQICKRTSTSRSLFEEKSEHLNLPISQKVQVGTLAVGTKTLHGIKRVPQ